MLLVDPATCTVFNEICTDKRENVHSFIKLEFHCTWCWTKSEAFFHTSLNKPNWIFFLIHV